MRGEIFDDREDDLVMVVLEVPYDTIQEQATQHLLGKIAEMKIRGYQEHYPYGVLPVDGTDYVATHQLVCRKTDDGLIPLTGYKSTTLERSRIHGIAFPGLALVRAANSPLHVRAVEEIISDCDRHRKALTYTSSWTMHPSVPKALRAKLRDMFEAMYILYHLEYGIDEILVGGTLRFKTDALFQFWGHNPVTWQDAPLPTIQVPNLLGENVTVMHLRQFTPEAIERARRWRFFWQRRITIAGDPRKSEPATLERNAA